MQSKDLLNAVRACVIVFVLSISLVTCVVGGGLYLWARQEGLNPVKAIQLKISLARHDTELNTAAGSDPSYRRFEIAFGDTAATVANNLFMNGLITDQDLFLDYIEYHALDSQLEAGTYYLQQTQTIPQIARALTDASDASIPFRMLAGWRIEEVADIVASNPMLGISSEEFLAVVGPGAPIPPDFKARMGIPDTLSNGLQPSLEGFLYPGDYELRPGVTAIELRDALLNAFNLSVTPDMLQQASTQGLTMYEVVTMASIVQREAVVDDERPVIASVYLNRLRLPMRLDADPTVQYAIGNTRDVTRWWPQITQDDYYGLNGVPNQSYSTYLNEGLPPGPIATPSLSSINAVLNPATTQYFYFRAGCDNDGRHVFFTLDQQADHFNFTCE